MARCEQIPPEPAKPAWRLTLTDDEATALRVLIEEHVNCGNDPLGRAIFRVWVEMDSAGVPVVFPGCGFAGEMLRTRTIP